MGSKLDFMNMYEICKNNMAEFDGEFYIAVKTTSIYCLPSCKAKFPLIKNVEFFGSCDKAQMYGYRPCKRCRPNKYPQNYPSWLEDVKNYIDKNFSSFIPESEFVSLSNVDITTIRRYFKQYFHLNLKSYQRSKRMKYALKLIEKGIHLEEIYTECGYATLKGFNSAFKRYFGYSPKQNFYLQFNKQR